MNRITQEAQASQKWNSHWQTKAQQPSSALEIPAIPAFVPTILPLLSPLLKPFTQHAIMLDAACGLGRGLHAFGGFCQQAYAVDASPWSIALAKQLWHAPSAPHRHLKIHWLVSDLVQAPLPQRGFEMICSFGYTDHAFFPILKTLLKCGGLWVHQGFSTRQREHKASLPVAWCCDEQQLLSTFLNWQIIYCEESPRAPFLLRAALQKV